MNNIELSNYYLHHREEFYGEAAHEHLLSIIKQTVKPLSDNVQVVGIDVGACVGNYIHHIKDICTEKDAKILCFEPNPMNLIKLSSVVKNDKDIKLFKHCLSNETSTVDFFNWKDLTDNYTGNEGAGLRAGGSKICTTSVRKLDDVLDEEFENKNIIIKFIKIDTEGNDSNVLKGMQRYLSKTKYIIFECSDCLDDIRGPGIPNPMKDIVDFLSANGFDTYRIGTKKLIKVNDEYWHQIYEDVKYWSNCFAVNKNENIEVILNKYNIKEVK
jgi:FkbM family methyltransferase